MSSSSSSLSIDDIWNSLANDEISNIEELHRKKATLQREKKKIKTSINSKVINNKDHLELMMHDLLLGQLSEKPKTIKSKNKSNNKQSGMLDVSMNIIEKDIVNITKKVQSSKDININNNCKNNDSNNDNNNDKSNNNERILLTANDMMSKIARYISSIEGSDDISIKKNSFIQLEKSLFIENTMSDEDYNEIFSDICKTIFKKFADPAGKSRELSMKVTKLFFQNATNFVPILGYFVPAFMQRIPPEIAFDEELKVFVSDFESHDAYKRGKAIDRQDKGGIQGMNNHIVIETSEETRLLACRTLYCLIKRVIEIGAASVLHPYFHEMVLYLQFQLKDPCPDIKQAACLALEMLAYHEEFVPGMKYFAVGLVRAVLPVLRHRHAKIRVAALDALKACMIVPDRAKCRGAGTEAMPDLVGFREENILQVAAFYKSDVQINYLAELAIDKSVLVREKLANMLNTFLTELPDRYDHQTRLLPYLLDLLTDDADVVSNQAMDCLKICGQQYEKEHPEDVIEKRQFGVDGDQRINLDKPYPKPFTERPRIGLRLYVRGNTKRYLLAIINELTSWQSKVRVKSAQLLKIVFFLCEEHLTMEAHTMLPSLIKALGFAKEDKDDELYKLLLEVYELYGRYTLPDTYIHYILPRLRGDPHVTAFGPDSNTRVTVLEFLNSLLRGTKPSLLPLYFEELVHTLTDPFVIDPESKSVPIAALDVILTIIGAMKGRGKAAIEGHFLQTGRLTTLKSICRKVFQVLLAYLSNSILHSNAVVGMQLLSYLDTDPEGSTKALFNQHSNVILKSTIQDYELDSWSHQSSEIILLHGLIECPFNIIHNNHKCFDETISFLCDTVNASTSAGFTTEVENHFLEKMSQLLVSAIMPLQCTSYPKRNSLYDGLICLDDVKVSRDKLFDDFDDGSWPGFLITHASEDLLHEELNDLKSRLDSILSVFVYDSRWGRTTALQLSRIKVLSLLLGTPSSLLLSSTPFYSRIIDKDTLLKSTIISDIVVSPAVHPSSPLLLRQSAIELQEEIIKVLTSNSALVETNGKLKSFKKQVTVDSPFLRKMKSIAQKGIDILVGVIDDPNDDIRQKTVDALLSALPLISSDSHDGSNHITNSFTPIISRLLIETLTNHNEKLAISLDLLLRQMAVLDAALFEQQVRLFLSNPNLKNRSYDDSVVLMLSQLIDHCDILMKFDK